MPEPSESFPEPSFASEPFKPFPETFGREPTFYNSGQMISSRVSNEPEVFVDPVKPSNERYESYDEDELETYQVPYQEQSIRRLDGPFEPYVPEKEVEKPKRKLLKVKIKKPVDKLEERRDYPVNDYPNWRPPIKPLNSIPEEVKYQKYQEDPKYEYNDEEYYYDNEDYREYEEYKPASYSKYEIFSTTSKPKTDAPQPYKRESLKYYDSPSVRYPTYQAPTTRYPAPTPAPVRYPTYNTPVTRYPAYNTPEPVPIPEQSYEGPRFTIIKDAQDRQSSDFGLDSNFEIPTFFKSSFEAPAFAEFNPPFGNSGIFIDFLKTVGKEDIPSTPFSARVESKTINTESSVPEIHRYGAYDTTANTIPFAYPKTEVAPGFYSTLLYTTATTVAPSTTTTGPAGEYQAPAELPKYKPEEPEQPEPKYQPEKPKEPTYQPPKEPEPQPKYKPNASYRPPITPIKDYTTTEKVETTTELEKPTESSVYYKPPEEENELTPGPVYYKPLDEDPTTTTSTTTIKTSTVDNDKLSAPKAPKKAKRPPSKKKPSRPTRPRKVKKPFLKMPSLKFPKLPKPSALVRRPSKKNDHRPPRPKSVQNTRPSKPRPKSDLAPPKKEQPVSKRQPSSTELKPRKSPNKKPKSHIKLLSSISDATRMFMKSPIHRKGPSIGQSTGVLLPYLSLLG